MSQQPLQQQVEASEFGAAGGGLSTRVVMKTAYYGGSSLLISGAQWRPRLRACLASAG